MAASERPLERTDSPALNPSLAASSADSGRQDATPSSDPVRPVDETRADPARHARREPKEQPMSAQWPSSAQAAVGIIGAAGTLGFLYFVGGVVMWLRLRGANLPTDLSLSLIPREMLVVVAVRDVLVPAIVSGVLAQLVYLRRHLESGRGNIRTGPSRVTGHVLSVAVFLASLVVAVTMIPLAPDGVVWLAALVAIFAAHWWFVGRDFKSRGTFGAGRFIIATVTLTALAAVTSEAARPALLPTATLTTLDDRVVRGDYLGSTADVVYLGRDPQGTQGDAEAGLGPPEPSAGKRDREVEIIPRSTVKI